MQVCKKFMACALCLCLIAGMLPTVSADSDAACTAVLTGNTGAVVTCAAPPLSVAVDDNALAIVEIRDNQVRVIAKEGAVGVARLTVQTAEGYEVLDVPVGYTTFVFDGGKLTVIPGSGSAYEISGINAAGTEYLAGDAEHPLPVTTDPTANYKNLKTDVDPAVPNSYRLTKVKDAVTVTVTAAPVGGGDEGWSPCDGVNCPGSVFQDMPPKSHWAHDSIDWAYTQGISSGTGSNSFSPNRLCTRAEIMTFLWRAAGSPEPEITESPFTDLKTDSYYYKAVLWAVEQGITAGTSETTFSPHKTCTRAEAISFLWHALGDPEAAGAENPFRDVKASDYFYQAVLWAAGEGVSSGTAPDRFSPDSICTRAQILTFLYRAFV